MGMEVNERNHFVEFLIFNFVIFNEFSMNNFSIFKTYTIY